LENSYLTLYVENSYLTLYVTGQDSSCQKLQLKMKLYTSLIAW